MSRYGDSPNDRPDTYETEAELREFDDLQRRQWLAASQRIETGSHMPATRLPLYREPDDSEEYLAAWKWTQ